ncbi:MAG TPA: ADOP family duplicated permease [Vicinamibacterales bacterium]|jgi:predicted permease
MTAWLRRLAGYLRRRHLDDDLKDEIRLHLELRTQALVDEGMNRREAEAQARRSFGNATLLAERSREVWRFRPLASLAQDLRFGARMMARAPLHAAVVVATIALGTGLNGAVFVLFNAALLRAPDIPEAGDVVRVDDGEPSVGLTYPDYVDYRDRAAQAIDLAAFSSARATVQIDRAGEKLTEEVTPVIASGNFFDVVKVRALLGRTFSGREDLPPFGTPVVVLGEAYWARRFNRDPDVVGRTIDLNFQPFTIVGVIPASFRGLDVPGGGLPTVREMYVPLWCLPQLRPSEAPLLDRTTWWGLQVIGRLRPGVTLGPARAQLGIVAASLDREYRGLRGARAPWIGHITDVDLRMLTTEAGIVAAVMGTATLMVLLIACANVANLALARTCARSREIAVRMSLGAARWRIVRQFLTESAMLSSLGTVLGFTIAYWVLRISTGSLAEQPFSFSLDLDLRVAAYAAMLAALVALVTGLVPALQASKPNILPALKDVAGTYRLGRLRALFIGGEVAICLVLLVTTALMVRSAQKAEAIDPVMPAAYLLAIENHDAVLLGYKDRKLSALVAEMQRRVGALPGVQSTALAKPLPFSGSRYGTTLRRGDAADGPPMRVLLSNVSASFFQTAGLEILRGRTFGGASDEVVISEALAARMFGDGDPLGQRLITGEYDRSTHTVVGVVRNAPFVSLQLRNEPFMFRPIDASDGAAIVARTAGPARTLVRPAAAAVRAVDPRLSTAVNAIDDGIAHEVSEVMQGAAVAGGLGALALVLSLFGVGAVTAHSVAQRTHEIGVRIALGAAPSDATTFVVRQSIRPVIGGLVVGFVGAAAVSRLAAALLYGLSSVDPVAFGSAGCFLLIAAAASAWLPARRAARVDPLIALRAE